MKRLLLLAAITATLPAFAQSEGSEAFVFAVVPRIQAVTKEVRECKDVTVQAAQQALQPITGSVSASGRVATDSRSSRNDDSALTPQWLVAENGSAKMVSPTEKTAALPAESKVGESCRLMEVQDRQQDGWQVFLRFQGKNVNVKVVGNPPQVGENVLVGYTAKGEVVITGRVIPEQKPRAGKAK